MLTVLSVVFVRSHDCLSTVSELSCETLPAVLFETSTLSGVSQLVQSTSAVVYADGQSVFDFLLCINESIK